MDTIDHMVARRLADYFADYPTTDEMTELKEELQADLSEAAHENEAHGETITDAVNHAFDSLGNLDDLVDEIMTNRENPTDQADHQKADDTTSTTHQFTGTHHFHGHHIDITDGKIMVDGGQTMRIDEDGVNIKNGKISVNKDGIRLGNLVMDDQGIRTDNHQKAQANPETDDPFADFDAAFGQTNPADTEIYVERLNLVNEQRFSASQVERIDFDYADAAIRVLKNSDSDEIIFREYMSRGNQSYFGSSQVTDGTLTIRSGRHPHLLPLRIRTQLLIPASFAGDLLLKAHSGSVRLDELAALNQVRLIVRSGSLNINGGQIKDLSTELNSGSLKVNHLAISGLFRVNAQSGTVRFDGVKADRFEVNAHSGAIRGMRLIGSGTFKAHSGSINLAFAQLTGNLDTAASSGSIKLAFAPDVEYNFDLDADSGSIKGPANAIYDHDKTSFKDGAVGDDPHVYVTAAAKSGSIRLA